MNIEFNKPPSSPKAIDYIQKSLSGIKQSGEGQFNKVTSEWLQKHFNSKLCVLLPSCTAGLEMAMILADIGPGDEVIMPSFTFSSTANAVVLFGGIPVFVDVDPQTMNIDLKQVEQNITPKTKAIMPVHYAGLSCDMDALMKIANAKNIIVIEDAAQAFLANYKNKPLGTQGHMSAFSFHDTKNISCGEGGALVINDERFLKRAYIIKDKGTNRQQFLNGEVDKYTWIDKGSSYLIPESSAAHLLAQLEDSVEITEKRFKVWKTYHTGLEKLEKQGVLQRMIVPDFNTVNAHIYYFHLNDEATRSKLITHLKNAGVKTATHYIPLHSAPAGLKFGRSSTDLSHTDRLAYRILRLPMHMHISDAEAKHVVDSVNNFFNS